MKALLYALLPLAFPFISHASQPQQLVPAGSLIQCTISEPKLSSKTAAIGDPVLCQVSPMERYGRSMLPYSSYLEGRFEDYKDPGHLIGKGWMELKFDRMVIEPDTVIPLAAKVVYVPGYNVNRDGRILGKGHAVADTVEWMIPILWPIDLINLPRRGPRPTLKQETPLTLKVMDEFIIPGTEPPRPEPSGLLHRPVTYHSPMYVIPDPPPPSQPITYAYPEAPLYATPPRMVLIRRNGYVYRTYIAR